MKPAPSPLVSIIVRTCNRPHLLAEALSSLAAQEYEPIEVVLVNDGGESVSALVKRWQGRFARFQHIVHNTPQGRSAALNAGLGNAGGEWIGFLDDDDLLLPGHVSILLRTALASEVPFVYGQCQVVTVDEHGDQRQDFIFVDSFSRPRLFLENYIPLISVLLHKQLVGKVGFFDESLLMFEDWDWFLRAVRHCTPLLVPECTSVYRRHGGSITLQHSPGAEKYSQQRDAVWKKHHCRIAAHWQEIGAWFIESRRPGVASSPATPSPVPWKTQLGLLVRRIALRLRSALRKPARNAGSISGAVKSTSRGSRHTVYEKVTEIDFVPFAPSPLPPGPWLVFAAHGDDETLGMGGSLLLARDRNVPVSLIILTDGTAGGQAASDMDLCSRRKAEVRLVAATLSVIQLQFWNQPDRQLDPTPALVQRVAELVRHIQPETVFFPSIMEYHPDHRAAASLVWQGLDACGFSGNRCAYEISCQARVNQCIDITSVVQEKKRLIALYQSQLESNNYLSVAMALNQARTFSMPSGIQAAEGLYVYQPGQNLHDPVDELQHLCRFGCST